jgi:hypothetical protein
MYILFLPRVGLYVSFLGLDSKAFEGCQIRIANNIQETFEDSKGVIDQKP